MKDWIRIRRQLYKQLALQVDQILGKESDGTMRYRREYEAFVRGAWRVAGRAELFERVLKSDVVLIGDFHALHQSQRGQLRILKGLEGKRKLILGVEFFESCHQRLINQFLSGALAEKRFLELIKWNKNWGFSWDAYRPLLHWARRNEVPVIGLNKMTTSREARTLKARDVHAAKIVGQLKVRDPDALIVVIYGDLHLAPSHLPLQIQKIKGLESAQVAIVAQNSEKLYFSALEQGVDLDVDVFKKGKNFFCLQNVPPWVKWQNYVMYLEKNRDLFLQDSEDDDEDEDETFDFHDEVARYIDLIAHDLGLNIARDSFSIVTPEEELFWERMTQTFSKKELKWFELMVQRGVSFYVPELSTGFLARASINHAASLAMAIIYSHQSGWARSLCRESNRFIAAIYLEAIQYFGTKLINPKRKTDTLQDLKASLSAHAPSDHGREALRLSLQQKMNEILTLSGQRRRLKIQKPKTSVSQQEAARLLGGMLGEKLFFGYRRGVLKRRFLASLVQHPVDEHRFAEFYIETLERIEGLPEPFLSKTDKL